MAESASDSALSRRARLLYGTLGLSVMAAGVLVPALNSVPDHGGSTSLTAAFGHAGQGLDKRSDVKVRGVVVGGVDSVRLDVRGRAVVRLRLDKGLRVPATAVAAVEPVSFFGPKDIALDLGDTAGGGPYLPDGGTITRTKDPEDPADTAAPAYDLASTIDPEDLATLLHTFSQGLSGQGPALRRTVGNGTELVDLAYRHRAEIRRLIDDLGGLSQTLGGRGATMTALAGDFTAVSPALTGRPDRVARLLDGASRLSDSVSGQLRANGGSVGGLIDDTGRAVDVLHEQRASLASLPTALTSFFQGLADVIAFKGPEGSLLGNVIHHTPVNPCFYLKDICADLAPSNR